MKRKSTIIALLLSLFPTATFAHFEEGHNAFLSEPMHWITQHYQGGLLVGIGIIGATLYIKHQSKKR